MVLIVRAGLRHRLHAVVHEVLLGMLGKAMQETFLHAGIVAVLLSEALACQPTSLENGSQNPCTAPCGGCEG